MLLAITIMASCEKENNSPTMNQSGDTMEQTATKNKIKNQKSALFNDIIDYEDDLMVPQAPADKEREEALLFIESIINHQEGQLGEIGQLSETVAIEESVVVSENGSDLEIEGADALDFYEDLETAVQNAYDNSDLYDTYSTDAFISVIDLDIPSSGSEGTESVGGTVTIKVELEPAFSGCSVTYDWKALDRLGDCSGGNTGFDAALRLQGMLTKASCNSDYIELSPCPNIYTYNMSNAVKSGFNSSNIWDGNASSDCITDNAIQNTHFPNYITEANNMQTVGNGHLDYTIKKAELSGKVAHKLQVFYASHTYWPCLPCVNCYP